MDGTCSYFSSDEWVARFRRRQLRRAVLATTDDLPGDPLEAVDDLSDDALLEDDRERLLDALDLAGDRREQTAALYGGYLSADPAPDECPHEELRDGRCVFHLDQSAKADGAVQSALHELATGGDLDAVVGANVGDIDLFDLAAARPGIRELDLRYASVEGDLRLSDATVPFRLRFTGARVSGELVARDATFKKKLQVDHARIDGACRFSGSAFEGRATFNATEFHDDAAFPRCVFGTDNAKFSNCLFHGKATFSEAEFRSKLDLPGTQFLGPVHARKAQFRTANVMGATFGGELHATGTTFAGEARFKGCRFDDSVDFRRARFQERFRLEGAEFTGGGQSFDGATVTEAVFEGPTAVDAVDLSGARIRGGVLAQPTDEVTHFDLSDCVLGDVALEPRDDEALFTYFDLRGTDFDGFDFSDYRQTLGDHWTVHRYGRVERDLAVGDVEAVYMRAKNAANEVGDSKAASEFFLREMAFRRKRQVRRVRSLDDWREVLQGVGSWVTNWFFNVTCGYGERPLRTVNASALTVVVFAALYGLAGVTIQPYNGPVSYLIFSAQTFVTFIVGATAVDQSLQVRALTSMEAFFGAFFVALFVFSLTRSIHR